MQPSPLPNDASYKIWSRLANWPQRYSSFIWILTEWQNHRILEEQGKSSIAPTFSKLGYNDKGEWFPQQLMWIWGHNIRFNHGFEVFNVCCGARSILKLNAKRRALILTRAPDKMRICVFHSNLNVKNSIIFGNVRIMYAKHFPDTQLCPVSKRICFVYILMECGLLPIFP